MLKPDECKPCVLYPLGNSFSVPDGTGSIGVCIVGESLGHDEAIEGKPFRPHAQAGSLLDTIIRLLADLPEFRNVTRESFLLWNIVACQPPRNELDGQWYTNGAISHCQQHFERVIGRFQTPHIKTILALGNVSLRTLTGVSGLAFEKQSITFLRGYVWKTKYGYVVPTYHTAYLQRGNQHLIPTVLEDFKKAIRIARGEYTSFEAHPSYVRPNYVTHPSQDDAWSLYNRARDNSRLPIVYDIESPTLAITEEDERQDIEELRDAAITQIAFSLAIHTGMAFPYQEPYITIAKKMLSLPNPKANHNTWLFDNPKLYGEGFTINGTIHDTMWMFKHWHPRLERGLQKVVSLFGFPFPWKHLFLDELEYYGCADVDAVQHILHKLPPLMKARGVWNCYMRHVVRVRTILKGAEDRGIPVDESKLEGLRDNLSARARTLDAGLQQAVPNEVRNVTPRRKDKETGTLSFGYKVVPKSLHQLEAAYEQARERLVLEGRKVIPFGELAFKRLGLELRDFADMDRDGNVINGQRWCNIQPFKASSQQLVKYIKYQASHTKDKMLKKLYKVPLHLKTKRPTTERKELEHLYLHTGDPVFLSVLTIRGLHKMLTNDIPNWQPGPDGRVHPQFHFGPWQGQKGARKPNVQNAAKHTPIGQEFRSTIVAPKGHVFIEFDKKGYHIATMGYCANDPTYIKFSQNDPHSIFASHVIKQPIDISLSPEEIADRVAWLKKNWTPPNPTPEISTFKHLRDAQCKQTVLGNQLGLGALKLQRMNRRYIPTVELAEDLQKQLASLFPKVAHFRQWIRDKAHMQTYLMNDFGRIAYFFDVYRFKYSKKDGQWVRIHGDDSEATIAFPVQSTGFDMLDEEMVRLDDRGVMDRFWFCDTIHDSLIFLPRIEDVEECVQVVYEEMSKPSPYLVNSATGPEGLKVGVEINFGVNWRYRGGEGEKGEVLNPEGMRTVSYTDAIEGRWRDGFRGLV